MRINKFFILITFISILFANCKKSNEKSSITFHQNDAFGIASTAGEFTITGHISSAIRLQKVTLTKEGQMSEYITDESTAKNKNEYSYSYLIKDITANTYINIKAFDQNGETATLRFLIRK